MWSSESAERQTEREVRLFRFVRLEAGQSVLSNYALLFVSERSRGGLNELTHGRPVRLAE